MTDPMERLIATEAQRIAYSMRNLSNSRNAAPATRAPNVIAVQGRGAVEWLVGVLAAKE